MPLTMSQSAWNAASPNWFDSSSRLVHCASACSAIHLVSFAYLRSGHAAGFCAWQSKGCTFAERARQRRLQKRTGQNAVDDDAGHALISGESSVSIVVQYPHAVDACCKSKISLYAQKNAGDEYMYLRTTENLERTIRLR